LSDQILIAQWTQDQGVDPSTDPRKAISNAAALTEEFSTALAAERRKLARSIIQRVDLQTGKMQITFDRSAIMARLTDAAPRSETPSTTHIVECTISQRKRGVEKKFILTDGTPHQKRDPDPALIDLVVRARRYFDRLTDGQGSSLSSIAVENSAEISEVSRALPFAFLAPQLVDAILTGKQPIELTAQRLSRIADLPLSWAQQLELISA
jgi:hypothetical protein